MVQAITLDIDVGNLFPSLPELSQLRRHYENLNLQQTEEVISDSGFSFMRNMWSLSQISQFIGIEEVHPQVRNAAITNRLLALTLSDEFMTRLERDFNNSTVLQRRWNIVSQALNAHKNRSYALSIPALLAQIEGAFTDALVLNDMAIHHEGKLCVKNSDGTVKVGRDDKPVKLSGLGQKAQNARFHNDDILKDLVEFFMNTLVTMRNDIMHGHICDYDKAALSVKLVFNIYILAAEIADFESEN